LQDLTINFKAVEAFVQMFELLFEVKTMPAVSIAHNEVRKEKITIIGEIRRGPTTLMFWHVGNDMQHGMAVFDVLQAIFQILQKKIV